MKIWIARKLAKTKLVPAPKWEDLPVKGATFGRRVVCEIQAHSCNLGKGRKRFARARDKVRRARPSEEHSQTREIMQAGQIWKGGSSVAFAGDAPICGRRVCADV